jgi:hypothetical protein
MSQEGSVKFYDKVYYLMAYSGTREYRIPFTTFIPSRAVYQNPNVTMSDLSIATFGFRVS